MNHLRCIEMASAQRRVPPPVAQCTALKPLFALPWSTTSTPRTALILVRHACAAQLKSAAGSYCKIPPCPLLAAYLDDDGQRAFVDSMAEVSVPKHEVIMRQGALPTQLECRVLVRVRVRVRARWRMHAYRTSR